MPPPPSHLEGGSGKQTAEGRGRCYWKPRLPCMQLHQTPLCMLSADISCRVIWLDCLGLLTWLSAGATVVWPTPSCMLMPRSDGMATVLSAGAGLLPLRLCVGPQACQLPSGTARCACVEMKRTDAACEPQKRVGDVSALCDCVETQLCFAACVVTRSRRYEKAPRTA